MGRSNVRRPDPPPDASTDSFHGASRGVFVSAFFDDGEEWLCVPAASERA
jgi:hypothetical protein